MGIKQLYKDNLRKLPNEYGDVSVMLPWYKAVFGLGNIKLSAVIERKIWESLWHSHCLVV